MLAMAVLPPGRSAPWRRGRSSRWTSGWPLSPCWGSWPGGAGGGGRRRGLALIGLALLALVQGGRCPSGFFRLSRRRRCHSARRSCRRPRARARRSGPAGPATHGDHRAGLRGGDPHGDEAGRRVALVQGVFGLEAGTAALRRFRTMTVVNATLMALFSVVQMLTWNGKIFWIRPSPSPNPVRSSRTATWRPTSTWGWGSWRPRCWLPTRGRRWPRGCTRGSGRRTPRGSWSSASSPRTRATASSAWSLRRWCWSPSCGRRGGGSSAA